MFYSFAMYSTSPEMEAAPVLTSIQRGSKEYIYNETISGFAAIGEKSDASLRIAVVCSDDRPCVESLFNQLRQAADIDYLFEEKFYVPYEVIAKSTNDTLAQNERDLFNAFVDKYSPTNSTQYIYCSQSHPFCIGCFYHECADLGQFNNILSLEVLLPLLCHSVNNLLNSKDPLANVVTGIKDNTPDSWLAALRQQAVDKVDSQHAQLNLAEYEIQTATVSNLEKMQELKQRIKGHNDTIRNLQLLPVHFRLILNLPSALFGCICSAVANGLYPSIDRVIWIKPDADFSRQISQQAVRAKNTEIAKGRNANEDYVQVLQNLHDDLTNNHTSAYLNDFVITWIKELPDFETLNLNNLEIHIDKEITVPRTNTHEKRTYIK